MKNKGKQKGITLIALVITIIVMLILVGVTINVALSGGLFNTAKTAKKNTATAKAKEQATSIIMGYYDSIEGKLKETTAGELLGELEAIEGVQAVTGSITEGYTVTMENEEAFTIGVNGTIANVSSYEDWDTWDGTTEIATEENGVYSIDTAEKLAWIAQQVKSGTTFEDKTIKLTINIDLNNIEWEPIGGFYDGEADETFIFLGNFDGNNKIIKNLKITFEYDDESFVSGFMAAGLIGATEGNVSNVTVQSATINATAENSGGIVGTAFAGIEISNCSFSGTITNEKEAAGILGGFDQIGLISNCTNSGTITSSNSTAAGITTGTGTGTISGCTNTGNILGDLLAGGISAWCDEGGTISGCTNTGSISANEVGGICGKIYSVDAVTPLGTIENCTYSNGTPATLYGSLGH